MEIRKLTASDIEALKNMETGINDDYVVRIFPRIVEARSHELFGLFENGSMVVIAGVTFFENRYAVLGRLRTDRSHLQKGYATKLLHAITETLTEKEEIQWIGAATNTNNPAAVKVLHKLGMNMHSAFHSVTIDPADASFLTGNEDKTWDEVTGVEEKRYLLEQLPPAKNELQLFPYECYYPLPYEPQFLSDVYLAKCIFYKKGSRFAVVMPDEKAESYFHVKYFHEDLFKQSGLWNTIVPLAEDNGRKFWLDLPPDSFISMPERSRFNIQDQWALYGRRIIHT
ncbi:GNAT family N-acetyltransferase [Bacillus marinisedimentorum]|uniref:GNAT family N-acetyltransferase n=1 Tax=Bacillus marinisedimentorum TaxID=1821260 RepID=UPI00087253E5|nr:GNAT family N-acetyltransferase [Bacillus marinisedimentorum]